MGSKIFFKCLLFYITLIVLSIFNTSSKVIINLGLNEGDICRKALAYDQEYVCTSISHCKYFNESIRTRNYLDICTIDGSKPIVCCPGETLIEHFFDIPKSKSRASISADEKCYQYSKLVKVEYVPLKVDDLIFQYLSFEKKEWIQWNRTHHLIQKRLLQAGNSAAYVAGGIEASSEEFPHMALLGYGDTTTNADDWKCGGSLISERWILTAAHCENFNGNLARWARLGLLARVFNEVWRWDYKIVEHVIHPDYKRPSLYNDIALFRLEKDVEFSERVRPICLNSYPLSTPKNQIATGWGRTATDGPLSNVLLKVYLEVFPIKMCNESNFSENDLVYKLGILPGSMICAGSLDGRRDTCSGDSGGPLQAKHAEFYKMYTQYGITSSGKFCAVENLPAIYTRVANYISWIEDIAFSND